MKYSFHPEAEIEFNVSIDYYEKCQANLGLEFANEVYETIQRILDFPNAWQSLDNDIRRCLINRFPFGIIYYQRDDEIIILAVMQLNRKPNYWLSRSEK
jgi:plasmid stabilization system protein ParE